MKAKKEQWFQSASLRELEEATKVGRHQWSRYFNGKASIRESTLKKAAVALNLSSSELLAHIESRRHKTQSIPFPQRHLAAVRRWQTSRRNPSPRT